MKLERKHVQLFQEVGRNSFIHTPANMEYNDGTEATDKDFVAIVSLRAALSVFKTMGLVKDETVTLDLREPFQS